jgi:sulfoxide reductase heme-binding subunit YedZ
MTSRPRLRFFRPAVLLKQTVMVAALLPFVRLASGAVRLWTPLAPMIPAFTSLTANPIKYVTIETGYWSLVTLIGSLAITPLRRLSGWHELIRIRRMLGLIAFFYAALHVLIWAIDSFFDVAVMLAEVIARPYLTIGAASFAIMLALAATSNIASISRLGPRWRRLHGLVYPAAAGGVLHFWWSRDVFVAEPRQFALILALLLSARVAWRLWQRRPAPRPIDSPAAPAAHRS